MNEQSLTEFIRQRKAESGVALLGGVCPNRHTGCGRRADGLLLEATDEGIETITTVCGYSSVRTIYRLFCAQYNMSPTSYRQMIRRQKKKQHIIINE